MNHAGRPGGTGPPADPGPSGDPSRRPGDPTGLRHETAAEKLDRNWNDLLQELRVMQTGTQIVTAFLIVLPFLVIDMVVSSSLMSMGMMMVSPALVALPFKLMLFVLADGWNLLLGSLAASFAT